MKQVPNSALTVSFLHQVPAPANSQHEGTCSYIVLCPHAKHTLLRAAASEAAKEPVQDAELNI